MTIKITQTFDERLDRTVLRVEGKLFKPDAELLERALLEILKEGSTSIEINLADISFLNNESATVLRRLQRLGAMLTGFNYFVQNVFDQAVTEPLNVEDK